MKFLVLAIAFAMLMQKYYLEPEALNRKVLKIVICISEF